MIKVSGYAAQQAKALLTPYSFERREPRDHDVMIDIQYCGLPVKQFSSAPLTDCSSYLSIDEQR